MAPKGKKAGVTRRSARSKGAKQTAASEKNVAAEEARFIQEHVQGLAKTILHAKWGHSEDEHEDHPGQSLATRSHNVIRHRA